MKRELMTGKKILVVDDERDVIDTIVDLLDMCLVDSATDFETAAELLAGNTYDAAILDIMGVNGYGLLKIATERQIPAIILTAHALSAENFKQSISGGAYIYLPKDFLFNIAEYLTELFASMESSREKSGKWFLALKPTFDQKFGAHWNENDQPFWRDFTNQFKFSKEELEKIL